MRPNMMTANTSVGMAMNGPCCPAKEEIWDKKYQKKIAGECKMPYYRSENVSTFPLLYIKAFFSLSPLKREKCVLCLLAENTVSVNTSPCTT